VDCEDERLPARGTTSLGRRPCPLIRRLTHVPIRPVLLRPLDATRSSGGSPVMAGSKPAFGQRYRPPI